MYGGKYSNLRNLLSVAKSTAEQAISLKNETMSVYAMLSLEKTTEKARLKK